METRTHALPRTHSCLSLGYLFMMPSEQEVPKILQDRRHKRNQAGSVETDSQKENSDTDKSDNPDSRSDSRRDRRPSSHK